MARLWLGALLIIGVLVLALARDEAAPPPPFDVPPEYEAKLAELDKAAIEAAYTQQLIHLFSTWMKDESGQPERVTKGLRQAQRAYVESMRALEARKPAR